MQAPPTPAYPPPPPGRGGIPVWAWGVIAVGCGGTLFLTAILAAILLPVFMQAREKARTRTCLMNQKQLALALIVYSQDYDDRFPIAETWMDATAPYRKGEELLHCPTIRIQSPAAFGYAFNIGLSRREYAAIPQRAVTPLIYDSANWARNATDPLTSLPVPGRHSKGNIIGFADGSVRRVRDGSDRSSP